MVEKPSVLFKVFAVLCSFLILFILYFSSLQFVVLENENFYYSQYTRLNSVSMVGLSQADVEPLTTQLIAYISGSTDTVQLTVTVSDKHTDFFSQRELLHLHDVRELYLLFLSARNIFFAGLLILITFLLIKKHTDFLFYMLKTFLKSTLFFSIGIIALSLLSAINFTAAFHIFHRIFSRNNNWMLSPAYDRLIVLMPNDFFVSAAIIVLISGLICSAAVSIIVALTLRRKKFV